MGKKMNSTLLEKLMCYTIINSTVNESLVLRSWLLLFLEGMYEAFTFGRFASGQILVGF